MLPLTGVAEPHPRRPTDSLQQSRARRTARLRTLSCQKWKVCRFINIARISMKKKIDERNRTEPILLDIFCAAGARRRCPAVSASFGQRSGWGEECTYRSDRPPKSSQAQRAARHQWQATVAPSSQARPNTWPAVRSWRQSDLSNQKKKEKGRRESIKQRNTTKNKD